MYLTHLDADGNDSPAILIDNTTAANRAVNIPEFANIDPDGMRIFKFTLRIFQMRIFQNRPSQKNADGR